MFSERGSRWRLGVMSLKELLEVGRAFARFGRPWFVAGGWAIDLHAGRVTREHHDVDVEILRKDRRLVHDRIAGFAFRKIIPHPEGLMNRGTLADWNNGERLELPIHQVNAYRPGEQEPAFQIMLGESDGDSDRDRDRWIYRRNPAVTRPLATLGFHPLWGLPYLAPEIVLLFKAKLMQPHDRADFDTALPHLSADARQWLRTALEKSHPGHEWIARL
jgi:hypothetical protein